MIGKFKDNGRENSHLNFRLDNASMHVRPHRLNELVEALDKMGQKPGLVDLATALENAGLTFADVEPHVQENPRNYNRATVVLRDQYELLVMTWLSGQASVAHDHGGSICAMLTARAGNGGQLFGCPRWLCGFGI